MSLLSISRPSLGVTQQISPTDGSPSTIPAQTSSTVPLAPLLALPQELKQLIFDYLSEDEDLELSLTILRRTHSILRNVIPRQNLSPISPSVCLDKSLHGDPLRTRFDRHCEYTRTMHARLKQLHMCERKHPYLFAAHHYPCYSCGQVLEENRFKDYESKHSLGLQNSLFTLLGSCFSKQRRCDDCLAVAKYDTESCMYDFL